MNMDTIDNETFGDDFSLGSDGSLEDSSPSPSEEFSCKLCRNKLCKPRLLSCLHTFCEECIDKQLGDTSSESKSSDRTLACPECNQETAVPERGASALPSNFVLNNMLDMCAIQERAVVCTSCKTKELAVSRCSDCANFLCPHCNTAHQFMRCFEDHHVVPFDELRKSASEPSMVIPIHKPIFCNSHPSESLKYFCHTCRIPICNDCMVSDHVAPQHRYERLSDAAPRLKEEMETLMSQAKKRATLYQVASADLENALSELQAQHDAAQDLIKETYQSYKAILENCRDDFLKKLRTAHKEKELKIMGSYHTVEKTMDRVTDACKFTSALLKHGNTVELTSLNNVVSAQLLNIVSDSPETEVNTSLEFITDITKFQQAVQANFGTLSCGDAPPPPAPTNADFQSGLFPPPPPLPLSAQSLTAPSAPITASVNAIMPVNGREDSSPSPTFSTISSISNGERPAAASTRNVSAFVATTAASLMNGYANSVTSSPVSVHSSYDSEISQITGYGIPPAETPPVSTPQIPPVNPNSICGLTSIQEYNLTQLASLADKVDMENARSITPSPTPSMSLTDLLTGTMGSQNHALNNLQALAKLGGMALSDRDLTNETMNGGSLINRSRTSPPPIPLPSPTASSSSNFSILPADSNGPNLNQQGEDLLPDSGNMGSGFGGTVSPMFPMPTSSFPLARDPSNKVMAMQVRLKFGSMGSGKGQFSSPHGFCLGCDEDIVVADTNNHRIQVFDKAGAFKFQFGVAGKEEGQLYYPRKVAVIRNSGKFVVCDRGNERSRLQIFTKNGHFVRKIAIRYIEILAGLAVTSSGHIVAVDSVSPTVFVISENGGITTWFNCSDYMMEPSDITVSGNEFFVCDFKGHAVVVFDENGKFKRRIGHEPVTNYPNGIDISDAGDVVVGDSHGNRFHVVVFNRKGEKLSEFECPYVKVSRCCGLKITSDGYVVTLAKNNHYVLVLNTLYIH